MQRLIKNEIPPNLTPYEGAYKIMLRMLMKGVFRLNRKLWMIPLSALMLFGGAGCANNNNRAGENGATKNPLRPVGYYSNENHPNKGDGFFTDNDGSLTELMDHTVGNEDELTNRKKRMLLQTRDENGNPKNPTTPLAKKDRNFFQRDNQFSTSDMNYHGHLNKKMGKMGVAVTPDFQENVTNNIKNTVADLDNVRSVRSVAYGNTIIISVKLVNNDRAAETKRAIRKAVKPFSNGRSVQVITDDGSLGRDRNSDNEVPQRKPW